LRSILNDKFDLIQVAVAPRNLNEISDRYGMLAADATFTLSVQRAVSSIHVHVLPILLEILY
jgi:hypothetical protein